MIEIKSKRKSTPLYTGVMTFNLVGVNPDREELSSILGTDIEREPVYTDTDREGNARIRLDFWFKNEEYGITRSFPIWLTDALVPKSSNNKTQYMGANGLSTYATGPEELLTERFNKWIFPDVRDNFPDFREAHVGEADLYQMLIALFKSDTRVKENVIIIDTDWSDIVSGNIEPITSHLTDNMKVQLLVAQTPKEMDNGGTVWNVEFYRKVILSEGDSTRRLSNQLKKDAENGYPYKGNYQDSFDVLEFDPSSAVPEQTVAPASEDSVRKALRL